MARRTLIVLVGLALLAAPGIVSAWLPTTAELRRLWDRDRALRQDLWLEYRSDDGERLEVWIRPDGLWGKRVHRPGEAVRTTWKWGTRIWLLGDGDGTTGRRREAGWDDWLFEPWAEVLFALEPPGTFSRQGLGRFPEGLLWVIGGRHEAASGRIVALEESPLRMRRWRTDRSDGTSLIASYEGRERYPAGLRFERGGTVELDMRRTGAVQRPDAAAIGWQPPEAVERSAQTRPVDPAAGASGAPR